MKTLDIVLSVTAEDIAAGVREDCRRCPFALALTRAACNLGVVFDHVAVGYFSMSVVPLEAVTEDGYYPTKCPLVTVHPRHPALVWLVAFDSGQPVEPITVTVTFYDRRPSV
jgi:hypothetical protein